MSQKREIIKIPVTEKHNPSLFCFCYTFSIDSSMKRNSNILFGVLSGFSFGTHIVFVGLDEVLYDHFELF